MYKFIGKRPEGFVPLTYESAWKGFKDCLSNAKIPCNPIKRYPVVARWRDDVEFTAAGIYCFQPHCVTGESEPPANPLICPQFCVRFNDLDNIGVTGRHYSGFIMLGIQAFNTPQRIALSKEDCTEINYFWLKNTLKIDPEKITFIEDVWAGGGNLGPSVEYFVGGLEIGNMVFMQYKVGAHNEMLDLPLKIIDVGIGLERIPWLLNGGVTSYEYTFGPAYEFLKSQLEIRENKKIWEKFAKYSCRLNADETSDLNKVWDNIGSEIGITQDDLKQSIRLRKDMCICLDHTRTLLMAIEDGSLPSNLSGGGNLRAVLRRIFSILHHNKWWDIIGMEGLKKLFELHRKQLAGICGSFDDNNSLDKIIETEYDRWLTSDEQQKKQITKLIKKTKSKLSIEDWILAVSSWGVSADRISELSGQMIPSNLYQKISEKKDPIKPNNPLFQAKIDWPETKILFYERPEIKEFSAKILDVVKEKGKTMVLLDKTAFYPLSGGQESDTGFFEINGEKFKVIECIKVGRCILHILENESPNFIKVVYH